MKNDNSVALQLQQQAEEHHNVERFKRAFWLSKDMFPQISQQQHLQMADALAKAFNNLKKSTN